MRAGVICEEFQKNKNAAATCKLIFQSFIIGIPAAIKIYECVYARVFRMYINIYHAFSYGNR